MAVVGSFLAIFFALNAKVMRGTCVCIHREHDRGAIGKEKD